MDVDDVVEAGGSGAGADADPVGGGGGSAVVDGSGGRGAAGSAGAGVTTRVAWVLLPVQRRPLPAARAAVLCEARGFASAAARKRGSRSPRRRAPVTKPSSEIRGRGVRIVHGQGRLLASLCVCLFECCDRDEGSVLGVTAGQRCDGF